MHDRKVPTFVVYGAGLVFLGGLGWAWVAQPVSDYISRVLGPSSLTSIIATTSCLATLAMQWLLIRLWRRWATPKAPAAEDGPRLSPDKRERIQTGQGA